jgi:hypothetical protein
MPNDPAEATDQLRRSVKKRYQKTVRHAIRRLETPEPLTRMRQKIEYWNLSGPTGITARRMLRELQQLKDKVPPRVSAAVLRTFWNGWTTDYRFQGTNHCVLGCNGFLDMDSIQHYSICPCVVRFNRTCLGLHEQDGGNNLSTFVALGLNLSTVPDNVLALRAISLYAVYRTTLHYRRHGNATDATEVHDSLKQFAKEAVRGHTQASATLDGRFIRGRGPERAAARESALEEAADDFSL